MRILVTGEGFLGTNLTEYLKKKKYNVVTYSSKHWDISNETDVKYVMNGEMPDVVYHVAAIANSKPSDPDQNRILDVNIKGTHNILRYMKPDSKIVFASSIVVYGDKQTIQNEFDDHRDCTSVYAATKVACEELIKAYSVLNDIDYTICRLGAMIGPYLTHGLIKVILDKLQTEKPYIELLGDKPGSVKPYTYIKDVVNKMVEIPLNNNINNRVINICNDDPISVEEVANIIMSHQEIYKDIRWLGDEVNWKGDNKNLHANNYLCKQLSKTGFLNSEDSIRKTLDDIR